MGHECKKYPEGIKWTRQRRDVYDVLFEAKEPLSAIQIYNSILVGGEGQENYAVSTIYRILTAFEEKSLVTRSNWPDSGTFVYELNRGEHVHYAICLSCHKHIPLQACPFAHMHMPETDRDFRVIGHKLELYGYCGECRAEG